MFKQSVLLAAVSAHQMGVWQKNSEQEFEYKHFDDALVSLESDPICSRGGCLSTLPAAPTPPKRDYFVPNFGKDPDMVWTLDNLSKAEEKIGHKVRLGTKESWDYWWNPAKDTLYNFAPELDEDVTVTHNNIDQASSDLGHPFEPASYSFSTG